MSRSAILTVTDRLYDYAHANIPTHDPHREIVSRPAKGIRALVTVIPPA